MRVGIFLVSASVAFAGVAFAQSDWVVDPWSRPSFTTTSSVARAPEAVPVEWVDERDFEITDPWPNSTPSSRGASAASPVAGVQDQPALPLRGSEPGDWAKPVPLLVDPWATEPPKAWAPAPDLIVDPWANDVTGP